MPKAIKKKIKQKTVGAETEVKDRLSDLKDKFREKQKTVLIYSIIAMTIVLVISAMLFYRYTANEESRQLEYQAYNIYYNEYPKKTLSKQEQFQQALDLFKQAYSKKKSPKLLLYIASSYYELGKYDEALTSLNDFLKQYSSRKHLLPLAYQKIAMIHLAKGNRGEALKTLDILYKSDATNIYKDFALIESGRILEKGGKKEEAIAKYKELTVKFPESPFIEEAKAKLGEKKEG